MNDAFWRRQPLLFGHVREDAATERWLIERHGRVHRAVVITSAGCTALSIADLVDGQLDAVDINPRQVALTELKLAALRELSRDDLVRLLTGPVAPRELCASLALSPSARRLLGELPPALPRGLQNCGRVDRFLHVLRHLLHATVHDRRFIEDFLSLSDIAAQAARFDREWDTARWRLATGVAFNRLTLALAFGAQAARNLPQSFAADVRSKVRRGLTTHPAMENGHAWQDFLGRYPRGDAALPCFARQSHHSSARAAVSRIRTRSSDVLAWLRDCPSHGVDFFALSNILELAPPAAHVALLAEVDRTAAPGATVCLRSILPFERLPRMLGLRHDADLSVECERRERALICNRFHILIAHR